METLIVRPIKQVQAGAFLDLAETMMVQVGIPQRIDGQFLTRQCGVQHAANRVLIDRRVHRDRCCFENAIDATLLPACHKRDMIAAIRLLI